MWWFKTKLKEEERLVKTFKIAISEYIDYMTRKGTVWIHCFENESGKRRITANCTFPIKNIDEDIKTYSIYNERILRWLYGATDSEISSFANSPQDDTVSVLQGK